MANWQRGPRNLEQVRLLFEQIEQNVIASEIFFCIRDALGEGVNISTSIKGRFYCIERSRKVTVKQTCIDSGCPYLVRQSINLRLGESLPFIEVNKALEVLK